MSRRYDRSYARVTARAWRVPPVLVGLLVCAMAAALLVAVSAPSAHAAPEITGKVRQGWGAPPLSGGTVRLWTNDAGEPGELVDSDLTNARGNFSLVPPTTGRYYVQFVHPDFRRGWLSDNGYFEPLGASTVRVRPGADLVPTFAIPTFVRGRVVNQATGDPVQGVRAIVLDPGTGTELGRARSGSTGWFRVDDVWPNDDSVQMKFNGSPVGYETGFYSCRRTVVPTVGEGCGSGLGNMGLVKIQRA